MESQAKTTIIMTIGSTALELTQSPTSAEMAEKMIKSSSRDTRFEHSYSQTVIMQALIGVYSDQGADGERGNGAHDFDVLGLIKVNHDGNFSFQTKTCQSMVQILVLTDLVSGLDDLWVEYPIANDNQVIHPTIKESKFSTDQNKLLKTSRNH